MKKNNLQTQRTFSVFTQETNLLIWIEAFLIDRKAQNLSKGTLKFYQNKLKLFADYFESQVITDITQIDPNNLRQFLLYLEETGHNPGGIHAIYRSVKAFLGWYENEVEPENWHNPIKKIKSPKIPLEPLEPVDLQDIYKMIITCNKGTFIGDRDKAILLSLLDTGARSQEFLDINLTDINMITGKILIRQGKGRKPRTVYIGSKSRKAVKKYLKDRRDNHPAFLITNNSERLSYDGLRAVITRRSKLAGIKPPSLHSFRRAFAINMLRAGVDIYSIQALLGHKSLSVLQRYLKITTEDARLAHRLASPVDNNL